MRTGRIAPLVALVGAAFLCAACGGGPSSLPGVASLGATTTTAAAAGSAAAGIPNPQQMYQDEIAYAECMRSHGVTGFPDPTLSSHGISNDVDVDKNAPHFQSATDACKHFLPDNGGPPTPAEREAMVAGLLKYSTCMQHHGEPNFPDPIVSAHLIGFNISGMNLNSPKYISAQKACHSLLPGGGP